jgi:hypothetical protein
MKSIYLPIFLSLSALLMSSASHAKDDHPVLDGPYIGQTPPSLTPEVFAPGIISKEHRDWTGRFTPDMKEYYFTRNNKKIEQVRQ